MASLRNRYSKSLEGLNAIGFVSPQLVYTPATTFAAFAASSASASLNGQIGIFNAVTGATRTTALAAGDKFFIAQIVDGNLKKTPIMTFGDANGTRVRKTVYNAPVKQVTSVGFNGTSGTSGIAAPTAGNIKTYVLSARDTSPSTQPFPIQEGRVVVEKTTATIYDIAAALITNFQNLNDNYRSADINFVEAQLLLVGTDTQIATVTATFTQGSKLVTYSGAHTLVTGEIVSIGNAGTSQVYKVASAPTSTTVILDRPYVGATVTTGAGGTYKVTVPTEVGIVITAIVEDTTFVLTVQEDLSAATITATTPWKQGAGAIWQVAAMEDQTQVMDSYTTINAQWPTDYGAPTKFAGNPDTGVTTFNQYVIQAYNKTEAMDHYNEQVASQSNVIIACPIGGNTPDATVSLVLTGA
jgi:hypothetical protein